MITKSLIPFPVLFTQKEFPTSITEMNKKDLSPREQLRYNTARNRQESLPSEREKYGESMRAGSSRDSKKNAVSWSNNSITRSETREYLSSSTQRQRQDLLPSEQREHVDAKMRVLGWPDSKMKERSPRNVVKDTAAASRSVDFGDFKRPQVDEVAAWRAEREKMKASK